MKVIGFTNKFYTLWEVTEDTRDLGNGHKYVVTHFVYVKNISFDKETAFSKYPGVDFDENLRGKTQSWDTEKEIWENVDTYRFGKFKYEKIGDHDIDYLAWYWDQVSGDHKEYVGSVLKNNGYEIRTWGDNNQYLVDPETIENEKKAMKAMNEMTEKLNSSESFEICFDHNPDEDGYCRVDDILYHFQDVKENWYNGFPYYLPVLNGKSKRIKNKNIKVTKFNTRNLENGSLVVEIFDFKIVK